jgi:hypothetical protein
MIERMSLRQLLWIDCLAGALVGSLVLALTASRHLQPFTGLPDAVLYLVGWANLSYASYACSLALRRRWPPDAIRLLIVANAGWACACLLLAALLARGAAPLGLAYLLAEAVFVAGLAWLEARVAGRWGAVAADS